MKRKKEITKAVIEEDKRYLLIKRSSHAENFPTLWDFPGGSVDPGEAPSEAVIRETKEETNLDIVSGPEVKMSVYEDDIRVLTIHYFVPESFDGEIELSPEHTEYTWLTREDMKELEFDPSVTEFFKESIEEHTQ